MPIETTALSMAHRLWPQEFIFSTGPLKRARNTVCCICTEPMHRQDPVLTHKACMHSFCAEDMLHWRKEANSKNTCPMCRSDVGEMRPANYDPRFALKILLRDGLTDLMWLIGQRNMFKVPLDDRLVSKNYLHVTEVCTLDKRYHPALIGITDLDIIGACHDPKRKDKHTRATLAKSQMAACDIISYWREQRGVRLVQEFQFPEVDAHARIFVPVEPEVVGAQNIEELRVIIDVERRQLNTNGVSTPMGWWLKRTVSKQELLGTRSLDEKTRERLTQSFGRRPVDSYFMLYQANLPDLARLYAVPRYKVATSAERYDGRSVWAFKDNDEEPVCSINIEGNKSAMRDPELYDFRKCLDNQYEGEDDDDTIIDTNDEAQDRLSGMMQNIESIRRARETLAATDDGLEGPFLLYEVGLLGIESEMERLVLEDEGTIAVSGDEDNWQDEYTYEHGDGCTGGCNHECGGRYTLIGGEFAAGEDDNNHDDDGVDFIEPEHITDIS